MEINRGDMKLLTECGFSGILRNIDTDMAPIFEALEIWMPEQGASQIGKALKAMVDGRLDDAADLLNGLVASERTGRNEARAMLAMVHSLKKDMASAERVASELEGQGGPAEDLVTLLVKSDAQGTRGDQGPVKTAAE